jgi:hypothetical protein
LKFAQPRGNASENVWLIAMGTNQLCAFARQICEALGVKFEPSIDMASGYRTHELKRSHQCYFWANDSTPMRDRYYPDEEDQAIGQSLSRETLLQRAALEWSRLTWCSC